MRGRIHRFDDSRGVTLLLLRLEVVTHGQERCPRPGYPECVIGSKRDERYQHGGVESLRERLSYSDPLQSVSIDPCLYLSPVADSDGRNDSAGTVIEALSVSLIDVSDSG